MKRIIVGVEHLDGEITPISFESAACAVRLSSLLDVLPLAVIVGVDIDELASRFAERTGLDVVAVHCPAGRTLTAAALSNVVNSLETVCVCLPQTVVGGQIAPMLAVVLDGDCITGVEDFTREGARLLVRRASHNAKIAEWAAVRDYPLVVTVAQGAFSFAKGDTVRSGSVTHLDFDIGDERITYRGVAVAEATDTELAEAEIIFAAGRGIGARENLAVVEQLAGRFAGGAVAGSRPVCDAGWLPYRRQVGQTGAAVRPRTYVACGVSGATQHVQGMREAEFVVAINKDEHAPIFQHANVGVVEDVKAFLPVLLSLLREAD
ncbi:MAG: electron transfer flavoprotein subunit alpha/FixB family protein [Candidatus Lernaella stagnicola]|nr:electron transfer flavoprotein subunit alpha/FixB family protein [Candidatus Lernaella stagnicola]